MHLIAHRGNTHGPQPNLENSHGYLRTALDKGFEIELDVWHDRGQFFLGHDAPHHPIDINFLLAPGRWCHAKNLPALELLLRSGAHCFWHENDTVTLTSRGYVWTYPGKPLVANSICLLFKTPTISEWVGAAGVCGDHVALIKDML